MSEQIADRTRDGARMDRWARLDPAAMMDFWRVYEARQAAITEAMLRDLAQHATLGPLLASMPKAQLDAQGAESLERMRQAVHGNWVPYEQNLRMQGAVYAASGLAFSAWSDLVRSMQRYVVPLLVRAYVSDPDRLSAALVTTQEFLDIAMTAIAEAYLDTKEAALRQSEERLATTLNSIGDAVIATDELGRVVRMNPIAEAMTGWALQDARGRPLPEVFHIRHEETDEPVESPAERVLRDGVIVGLANHTVVVARDGARRPIADSGAPIRGGNGEILGVVLVFRDMSEERTASEMRTRSLLLEAENAQVLEASRLKSEFLANMSHELRTPLNAIIGFTELIHYGHVEASAPEFPVFLGHVLTSARHLLQLINDVLDLSKVEAGKVEFHPEDLAPGAIILEVESILGATARAAGIELAAELDPQLGSVRVDPARLKQLLYNYVSNALKFTDAGGRVVVRATVESTDTWRIEVEDTGVGIAEADLQRLFVEFQQLDTGSARKHEGTGLGLALTRRLVEAQGGSVGVRSTVGVGSVFHALLPRQCAGPTDRPSPRSAPAAREGAPVILVVEDDLREQEVLVRTLVDAGYAVETAPTGALALARCAARTYDAVTLDLALTDRSGLDVLRALRDDPRYRAVPVLVVSVVAERGAVAGFAIHDILSKPLDTGALLASLRRAGVSPDRRGDVLVVDDDLGSASLMAATLAQLGYRARCAENGAIGLQLASEIEPLAVVLDLLMPGMDGFTFLDCFRRIPNCARTPVIVWTVKDLTPQESARLRASAESIVLKGRTTSAELLAELRTFLPPRPNPELA
ncbi:MAG: response regulator [Pseudomonadota bacterium]|nr:response regulator [Pseudomonadota bacterium]